MASNLDTFLISEMVESMVVDEESTEERNQRLAHADADHAQGLKHADENHKQKLGHREALHKQNLMHRDDAHHHNLAHAKEHKLPIAPGYLYGGLAFTTVDSHNTPPDPSANAQSVIGAPGAGGSAGGGV